MAQRAGYQDDNDEGSQLQRISTRVKVKTEKARVKHEIRVKAEKVDKGKQKQRIEDSEEDAAGENDDIPLDEEGDDDDGQGAGSPKGRKRLRVNNEGGSRVSEESDRPRRQRVATQDRDIDGYIPGSIVRIQLRNFVTYDFVEFRPGPYLNMILGPNGTGKSSIACAICLGLNWPPAILGRATDLNSFVKTGTEDGHIEIELKGPRGKGNLVIRRNIKCNTKGSTFTLNGQHSTGKEITAKMAELNVQVGNLCSFLPQDKVSEFAAMSPQELLRQTQLAAGNENLTEWHDTLINAGKELRLLKEGMTNDRASLKTMQERNEALERDVLRYQERKNIEHDIALIQVLLPVQRYRESKMRYDEAKQHQRTLFKKVQNLQARNKPAHNLLQRLRAQHGDLEGEREQMKKAIQQKYKQMGHKWQASEKLESDAEDLTLRLDRLRKEEKERQKKIKQTRADIVDYKAELEKPLETEDVEVVNAEIRQVNLERQDVIVREGGVKERIQAIINDQEKYKAEINRANDELRSLDDIDVRKLQNFRKINQDHHDALMWLRNHRELFRMEVFEPPFMSLTIPDRRYTNAVEALFSHNQILTFVFQCQEDYETFNRAINDNGEKTVGRHVRINTWFMPCQENALGPPPMTQEELQRLGFDGYAIDFVECPPGMRWFLKRNVGLHRNAIALDEAKVDVASAMQTVSRIGPNGEGGSATFIAGNTICQVLRSRYGRRTVQNMTKDIKPASRLVAPTIDAEFQRQRETTIKNARRELQLLSESETQAKAEYDKVKAEDAVYMQRLEGLQTRKQKIRDALQHRGSVQAKLDRSQKSLKTLLSHPSVDAEEKKIKKQIVDLNHKRIAIVREFNAFAAAVMEEQVEATRVGLQYLQIGANKVALEYLCEEKDAKYHRALADFNEADKAYQRIKAETTAILTDSREVIKAASPEIRDEYKEVEKIRAAWEMGREQTGVAPPTEGVELRTVDQLEADLLEQQNNLELNLATNPGVIEQYEKRKQEIENLSQVLEEKEGKERKLEKAIKRAKDNWQPALQKLVDSIGEKFSAAFDRINCAGEIRISEHEDFEKWAIDILVKFRDNEKLQLLTSQRQSGGERSLTTILYLMSLTEEARAPFSLVDEINQGMDQRAERNIHNSMVEVTCKADSAQYFLITPKLLPDLRYHERMKILCVNNGEWLPEEKGLYNMLNMIETFAQRRNNRAPSTV